MLLIPAIDLRGGHCVRLLKGEFDAETRLRNDPLEMLGRYRGSARAGCTGGSGRCPRRHTGQPRSDPAGRPRRHALRSRWAAACARATVAEELFGIGVQPRRDRQCRRGDPAEVRQWLREFGADRVVLAIDVRVDAGGTPRLRRTAGSADRAEPVGRCRSATCRARRAPRAVHRHRARRRAVRPERRRSTREACGAFPPSPGRPRAASARGADLRALAATGAGRRHQRQGPARRPHSARGAASHSCPTHNSLPRRARRPGRQGRAFRDHRVVGDILELAARYRDEGADELVFYDITASPRGPLRRSQLDRPRRRGARHSFLRGRRHPLACADAEAVLNAGAEKISVNSPALADPALIDRAGAHASARSAWWSASTARRVDGRLPTSTSSPATRTAARSTRARTLDWVREVQDRGAGEIVLNCMASDGVRNGYDLRAAARRARGLPRAADRLGRRRRARALRRTCSSERDVDGALAASVFHSGAIAIPRSQALPARAAASRCVHDRPERRAPARLGARATACCRPSCRTRAPAAC